MYHTTNIGQLGIQISDISTCGVDVNTISHAGGKYENWHGTTLNTDTITLQSNIKSVCSITPISNKV